MQLPRALFRWIPSPQTRTIILQFFCKFLRNKLYAAQISHASVQITYRIHKKTKRKTLDLRVGNRDQITHLMVRAGGVGHDATNAEPDPRVSPHRVHGDLGEERLHRLHEQVQAPDRRQVQRERHRR